MSQVYINKINAYIQRLQAINNHTITTKQNIINGLTNIKNQIQANQFLSDVDNYDLLQDTARLCQVTAWQAALPTEIIVLFQELNMYISNDLVKYINEKARYFELDNQIHSLQHQIYSAHTSADLFFNRRHHRQNQNVEMDLDVPFYKPNSSSGGC